MDFRIYLKRTLWQTPPNIWLDTFDFRAGSWEITKGFLFIGLRVIIVGLGLLLVFSWSSSEIPSFLNQAFLRWFSANSFSGGK